MPMILHTCNCFYEKQLTTSMRLEKSLLDNNFFITHIDLMSEKMLKTHYQTNDLINSILISKNLLG